MGKEWLGRLKGGVIQAGERGGVSVLKFFREMVSSEMEVIDDLWEGGFGRSRSWTGVG